MKCTFWVKIVNRLKHTQSHVCEQKKTFHDSYTWYKSLHYIVVVPPCTTIIGVCLCAAYVVLIGQSVTERKPAGYRTRPRRAIEVAACGRRAACVADFASLPGSSWFARLWCTMYCRHCACRRRKPPKQLAFFLSPIQHHVRGKLPLDKSTLYHRTSLWSHTNQKARIWIKRGTQ